MAAMMESLQLSISVLQKSNTHLHEIVKEVYTNLIIVVAFCGNKRAICNFTPIFLFCLQVKETSIQSLQEQMNKILTKVS